MGKHRHQKVAKMRQMPGDLHRLRKIQMMEKDVPVEVFPWQTLTPRTAKSFRSVQRKRAKVKVKRRLDREMSAALQEE